MSGHSAQKCGFSGPRARLEARLEQLETWEPRVQAFVARDDASARRQADAATARLGDARPLSSLDGLVLGVKDVFETRDFPTAFGSPLFEGFRTRRNAEAVAALLRAGAIPLGKTVTTEFAVGAAGPTRNPYDLARSPGGSSSGSAAAVAAGMAEAAIGTQTQSSTLRPASYCGVVGLKMSHGAAPLGGVHPLAPTMDALGVFAPSVELAWNVAATALGLERGQLAAKRPSRLGLVLPAADIAAEARSALERAAADLADQGVEILIGPGLADLETSLAGADAASDAVLAWEMQWPFGAYYDADIDLLGARVRGLVETGRAMSPDLYRNALADRRAAIDALQALDGKLDGILSLSAPGPAPLGLETDGPPPGARSLCIPASLMGAPAISLPVLAVDGLPLGLQLIAPPGRDDRLAAVALWLEGALGGRALSPPPARQLSPEGD